jgi:hypothetical protein
VTLDYEPTLDGERYDPEADGGSVLALDLFADPARTGTPVLTAGPAVRVTDGRYRFAFDQPADGTYYAKVTWRETATADPFVDVDEVLTFPLPAAPEPPPEGLIVSLDEVARRAGLSLPLSPDVRQALIDAITDAQADVEGFLGQPLIPQQYGPEGSYRYGAAGLAQSYRLEQGPVTAILAEDPSTDPTYFYVTYLAGLDARNVPAITRYVRSHAASLVRQHPRAKEWGVKRGIRSVSVDGQSVSYDNEGTTVAGGVGSLPTLDSLSMYRRKGKVKVFQRRGAPYPTGGLR